MLPALLVSHMGSSSIPAASLAIEFSAHSQEKRRGMPKSLDRCTHTGDTKDLLAFSFEGSALTAGAIQEVSQLMGGHLSTVPSW